MKLPDLRKLTDLDALLLDEIGRGRLRVNELKQLYPSAGDDELARRLIDQKRALAGTGGAVTGLLGLFAIPAGLAFVSYLQLTLAIELAVLHHVNLKSSTGRAELLEVLGFEEGDLGPMLRAAPRIASRLSGVAVKQLGWRTMGRVVPVVAAPLGAWLDARELERTGAAALRRWGAFRRLKGKRVAAE